MEIRYTVHAVPRTKKNSQDILINRKTGKPFIRQNPKYLEFEEICGWQLRPRPKTPIDFPVNVKEVFFMDSRRIVDQSNLIAAMDDILVKYGILKDDNSRIVVGHDGSRVFVDAKAPRIEITITRVNE